MKSLLNPKAVNRAAGALDSQSQWIEERPVFGGPRLTRMVCRPSNLVGRVWGTASSTTANCLTDGLLVCGEWSSSCLRGRNYLSAPSPLYYPWISALGCGISGPFVARSRGWALACFPGRTLIIFPSSAFCHYYSEVCTSWGILATRQVPKFRSAIGILNRNIQY